LPGDAPSTQQEQTPGAQPGQPPTAEQGQPPGDLPTRTNGHRGFDYRGFAGRYAVVLAWLVMVGIFSILRPSTFATSANLKSVLVTQAVLFILALGLTIALAAGEFDLSIASIIGFTAGLIAHFTTQLGWAAAPALLLSFAAVLLIGAVNAFFVVRLGVNSFITTLGMGTLVQGLALAVTGETTIGITSSAIVKPSQSTLLGFGLPVFYALVLATVLWYFLEHTPQGRYVFFTGEGPEAARLAGVRVNRIRAGALIASALFAWFAGAVLLGQTAAADPTYGGPFLLPAFAAGFLGATTIKPGRFNAWGTVIAVLLLATATNGLQLLGAADYVTDIFNGAVLIIAVTLARLASRG
jgi:ribose transport system permease protein